MQSSWLRVRYKQNASKRAISSWFCKFSANRGRGNSVGQGGPPPSHHPKWRNFGDFFEVQNRFKWSWSTLTPPNSTFASPWVTKSSFLAASYSRLSKFKKIWKIWSFRDSFWLISRNRGRKSIFYFAPQYASDCNQLEGILSFLMMCPELLNSPGRPRTGHSPMGSPIWAQRS